MRVVYGVKHDGGLVTEPCRFTVPPAGWRPTRLSESPHFSVILRSPPTRPTGAGVGLRDLAPLLFELNSCAPPDSRSVGSADAFPLDPQSRPLRWSRLTPGGLPPRWVLRSVRPEEGSGSSQEGPLQPRFLRSGKGFTGPRPVRGFSGVLVVKERT